MSDHVPLPSAPLSPVSIDTLTWASAGRAYMTVSVRADVRLVPGGVATLTDPQPPLRADHYTMPGPTFRTPRQVVPSLLQPEVTLMACAHAKGATEARVRLAVFRADGARLIDKTLLVRDRKDRKGQPRAVDGLQLDYCSAVGGIGFGPNPLGRGKGRSAEEAPHIVDPDNPEAVVGFCPVPAGFAARAALLGAHYPKVAAGDLSLPEGFDHRFFQAAPADQRVAALRGDERIVLEHMNAEHPVLDTRLPGLTAVARLYGQAGPQALALRLESVHIDAEEMSATLVWRTTFASPSPARPTVAAQLVATGQTVEWPASVAGDAAAASSRSGEVASSTGTMLLEGGAAAASGTVLLAGGEEDHAATANSPGSRAPVSLPFARPAGQAAGARSKAPTAPAPGAPWAQGGAASVRPAHEAMAGTLALTGSSMPVPSTPVPEPRDDGRLRAEEATRADEARRADEAKRVEETRLAQERAEHEARGRREIEREEEARVAAERFAKEQAAARKTEDQRRAAEAAERASAIKGLKKKAYGGFDD